MRDCVARPFFWCVGKYLLWRGVLRSSYSLKFFPAFFDIHDIDAL